MPAAADSSLASDTGVSTALFGNLPPTLPLRLAPLRKTPAPKPSATAPAAPAADKASATTTTHGTYRQFVAVLEQLSGPEHAKLRGKLEQAMSVISEAIERYGPYGVSLSFNGGKDCTVLLFLMVAGLEKYHQEHPDVHARPIKTLYVSAEVPFDEMDQFVDYCEDMFQLDLMKILGGMKPALERFLDSNRVIKAILVGTRRTDPYSGSLHSFAPTDSGWPPVMRVLPILDWEYTEVWEAIKLLRVPYCSLYDKGYTSLGGVHDTVPNPHLQDAASKSGYLPAYALKDGTREREGRTKR
ncbi:hypothetical protein BC831DRAFT_439661 [Entophlyctis helioformis]|nr:hypothetical protein BC831DRAFT_439661 [Entophlyctis helioformis]